MTGTPLHIESSDEGPECPYCRFVCNPQKLEAWELYDEDTEEFDCTWCLSKFKVEVIVSHTWLTEKMDEEFDA